MTTALEYEVRPYEEGDEAGIVELLSLALPGWPGFDLGVSTVEHWEWKFGGPDGSLVSVAESGGAVVGCSHVILCRCIVGGEELLLGNGLDVAVHPDFRKRGIFNAMTEQRMEMMRDRGVSLAFWSTSNPILKGKWDRESTPFPRPILDYVKVRDVGLQLRAMPVGNPWLWRMGYSLVRAANSVSNAFRGAPGGRVRVDGLESFDEDVDRLWEEVSRGCGFVAVRNMDYLNWRYCDPRAGKFEVRGAVDGGLVGYSVLSVNKAHEDYPVGYIVDIQAEPDRPDTLDALISDAVTFFDARGVNLVNCLVVKGSPLGRALGRRGFLNSRVRFHLAYDALGSGDPLGSASGPFHFCFGDRDSLPMRRPSRDFQANGLVGVGGRAS